VRTGAPKPAIATADEVRRVLLEAKYISFPNAASGAAAGVSFEETMRKLGITEAMKPKIKPPRAAAVQWPCSPRVTSISA
jgi:molybdate transport system substrate-binding protein